MNIDAYLTVLLEGHYESAADINSSGKIDVLDYQAAVNKALAS